MKRTIYKYLTLFVSSAFLLSCGGSSDDDDDDDEIPFDPTETQVSVDAPIAGDVLTHNPTTNGIVGSNDLTFAGTETVIGETSYLYQKTGTHTFSLTVDRALSDVVDNAVNQLLGAQSLGTEFRQLLLDTDQDGDDEFENPDLERMTELLAEFGTSLRLSPDGTEIHFPVTDIYDYIVTSNAGDFLIGALGGLYTVESTGVVVGFRRAESTDSRFFDDPANTRAEFWVPTLTDEVFYEESAEQGTYTINFVNFQ